MSADRHESVVMSPCHYGASSLLQQKRGLYLHGYHNALDGISSPTSNLPKKPRSDPRSSGPRDSVLVNDTHAHTAVHPKASHGKGSSCPPLQSGLSLANICCEHGRTPPTPCLLAMIPTAAAAAAVAAASQSSPANSCIEAPSATASSAVAISESLCQSSASKAAGKRQRRSSTTKSVVMAAPPGRIAQPLSVDATSPRLALVTAAPPVQAAFAAARKATAAEMMPPTSPASGASTLMDLAAAAAKTLHPMPSPSHPPTAACRSSASASSRCRLPRKSDATSSAAKSCTAPNEGRAGGYQGRFCGRLYLKDDEAKLASECQLLGPLLGCRPEGGGRSGDPDRHTMAKIARGIASGAVRQHCLSREQHIKNLEAALQAQKDLSCRLDSVLNGDMQTMCPAQTVVSADQHGWLTAVSDIHLKRPRAALAAASAAAAEAQAAAGTAPVTIGALSSVAPPSAALRRALRCKISAPPPPRFSATGRSHSASAELSARAFWGVSQPLRLQSWAAQEKCFAPSAPETVAASIMPHSPLLPGNITNVPPAAFINTASGWQDRLATGNASFSPDKCSESGTKDQPLARLSLESVADSCSILCNAAACCALPSVMADSGGPPRHCHLIPSKSRDTAAVCSAISAVTEQVGHQPRHTVGPSAFNGWFSSSHRSAFHPVQQRGPPEGVTRPAPYRPTPLTAVGMAS